MKILIITQVFYPDTASVSQHLEDLAISLVNNGHQVKVLTSKYTYEENIELNPKIEFYNNIEIRRIRNTTFSKNSILGRAINFATFNLSLFYKLMFVKKGDFDLILGTTQPPFISIFGIFVAKLKKIKFAYWMMDIQPGISIATGLLKEGSWSAKFWQKIADYIFKSSDLVITLDRFMKNHLVTQGAEQEKISVVPVWPVMSKIFEGKRLENPFRIENNFGDKIVIMYSGNHSYVHPLDTILETSLKLRDNDRFLFVFIGGGVRTKDVKNFKAEHQLDNIVQLAYQPRNRIHLSLGSADLQLVILGDGQVGYTHPNKIYGALFIGKPVIYIGPKESHATDMLDKLPGNISLMHGEVDELTTLILDFEAQGEDHWTTVGKNNLEYAHEKFSPKVLRQKMVDLMIT